MAEFSEGDRVAVRDDPETCGIVVSTIREGPAGMVVVVEWDDHPESRIADSMLVRCDESESTG